MKPIDFQSYKIKTLPKENMHGYWGLNHNAAKKLHVPIKLPKKTVVVSDSHKENVLQIATHEMIENHVMEELNCSYQAGHKIATKLERLSQKQINEKLSEI